MVDYLNPAVSFNGGLLKANSFLYCPSMAFNANYYSSDYVTYGMNQYGISGNTMAGNPYRLVSQIKYPDKQVAFGDSYTSGNFNPKLGGYIIQRDTTTTDFRHNKLCNYVYCDGHVEAQNVSYLNTNLATWTSNWPFGNP